MRARAARGYAPGRRADHDHRETVEALLARGADTTRVNDRGQTVLGVAVFRRSERGVRAVLAVGADPDGVGRTAREIAVFFELERCRASDAGVGAGAQQIGHRTGGDDGVTTQVRNADELHRYEIREDGELLGFAAYRLAQGRVVFTHTEIEPAHEGKGAASTLVREALDDVRRRDLRVEALCPYVSRWMSRHPDYQDLDYRSAHG